MATGIVTSQCKAIDGRGRVRGFPIDALYARCVQSAGRPEDGGVGIQGRRVCVVRALALLASLLCGAVSARGVSRGRRRGRLEGRMSESYSRWLLRVSVAQVCQALGWDSVQLSACEVLTDVLQRYLHSLGRGCRRYCELCECLGRCHRDGEGGGE